MRSPNRLVVGLALPVVPTGPAFAAPFAYITNSGYALLINYSLPGPGTHTATICADGAIAGTTHFTVTTLGTEFSTGAQGSTYIGNLPMPGKRGLLSWQQATQNFFIASTDSSPAPVTGNYLGAISGTASNCGSNSSRITNNDVRNAMTQTGNGISIAPALPGNVPSACTPSGTLQCNVSGTQHAVQYGTCTCNDSARGTFSSTVPDCSNAGLSGNAAIVATMGCTTDLRMGGARLP